MKHTGIPIATVILAAVVAGFLLSRAVTTSGVDGPPLSVDTTTTGNTASTVATIDACRSVASGSPSLTVDIVIQNVASLAGFEVDLLYDQSVVTVVGEQSTFILPYLPPAFLFDFSDPVPDSDGRYHMLVATTGEGSGNGVVVRLTLQPGGAGNSPLNLDKVKLRDVNNNAIQPVDGQGFYSGPVNNGTVIVGSGSCSDADGDGVPDATDNCPNWPNASQALPPWTVPPGDPDCDGFDSTKEASITTLLLQQCPATTSANDEEPDQWPPDFNDNQSVNITDVLALKPVFATSVPPTSARYDIAVSGAINISDVLTMKPYFNQSCS